LQAEDGIRDRNVTGVQTCALPISSIAPLLKKDGLIIYSTCTIDKEENEYVVKKFLESHLNYEVDHRFFETLPNDLDKIHGISGFGLQLFPQDFHTDGFFLTRLIKKY